MLKKFLLITLLISASYGQNLMTAEDAIMLGLKNNFDIQIARNQEEIAGNNAGKSISGFLPTLGVTGSYQDQKSKQEKCN